MKKAGGWVVCACVALAVAGRPGRAATPQEVEQAIKRGVQCLYARQHDGNWEHSPTRDAKNEGPSTTGRQWGGLSAMATYALLAAGESSQDGRIKAAAQFLRSADIQGTYALGMRAQIWTFLPQTGENREGLKRDASLLMSLMKTSGEAKGLYSYWRESSSDSTQDAGGGGRYDHSCSNYGVLGMWACAQMNLEIPGTYWEDFDRAWRRHQLPDGGWCYINGDNQDDWATKARIPMTSAGVATLFITQDYLYSMRGLNCTGNIVDENIERGIKWMSAHFKEFENDRTYYALYNIERVGVASGHKYFGTVDWYKHGADFLVRRQGGDGGWGDGVPDTCWAILFLVRGRAPVMMNKLEYSVDTRGDNPRPASWNERPRDVANITRWTAKQIERDLNWQIVNLKVDIDELHDAPILYISGREALNFRPEEEARLKLFVEQGGLILGNADCASANFTNSFRKLGEKLFHLEFRALPGDHPIYASQQYRRVNWKAKGYLLGLSNGARELMLLFGGADPAKGWQTQGFMGPEREPLAQIAANIFLYAVDKQNLRYKGQTYIVHAAGKPAQRTVKVARLDHGANWDPEPGGWRRLAAVMHNQHKTDLSVQAIKLGEGKLDKSFAIAHLTGTAKFTLSAPARAEIKKYIEGGGTLLIDSAGGYMEFAQSAEAEMKDMFPDNKVPRTPLPINHPVFSSGYRIEEVDYRSYAKKLGLGNLRTPRLRGIEINGRTAVFLSDEDLSVGLVGQPIDGINGYVPFGVKHQEGKVRVGATEIVSNIILYALPSPTTKEAGKKGDEKRPAGSLPAGR